MINNSLINSGLPQLPEGVPNEAYNHFVQIYNAIHKLEALVAQYTGADSQDPLIWSQLTPEATLLSGNMNRLYLQAYEVLSYGNCVALVNDAGTAKFRKANATNNTKPAFGFVNTPGTTAIGSYVEVICGVGLLQSVGGLTPGTRYFLSTTDGVITNGAPVAAGNIEQVLGVAITASRLFINISPFWIQH